MKSSWCDFQSREILYL